VAGVTMSESTGDDEVLLVQHRDAVRVVVLNRPAALNAANDDLHRRLAEVWDELVSDRECRAVVLTGAGRAFSAGGDLGVLAKMNEDPVYRDAVLSESRRIVRALVQFPLPIIAAVNGPAVGLGCSLAALSDIVLIEESAYLSDPHVSIGLVAADGGAMTWPTLTSLLRAKEYLFTGDRIPAKVAVELGLANRVVDDGTSVEQAIALAQRLARQPPQALRDTKRAINKHLERAILEILDFAVASESISSASEEHREIVAALRAKAAPR
jgi:enoyl-CoA hydratase